MQRRWFDREVRQAAAFVARSCCPECEDGDVTHGIAGRRQACDIQEVLELVQNEVGSRGTECRTQVLAMARWAS